MKENRDVTICLSEADVLKSQGNDLFRSGRWGEALVAYQSGLGQLPKRKQKVTSGKVEFNGPIDDDEDKEDNKVDNESSINDDDSLEATPATETDILCSKARAILSANIGACHLKLGDYKSAVETCSQALLDDPRYVKALQRRALSNEKINSWSSLTSAQEDYTFLLTLLPTSSPLVKETEQSLRRVKPLAEAAQKTETTEMLNKLKGLGNSILGNFGLSTDNFKFEPNGQGGYSMNFSP
ncbi:hypothetical protein BDZ94DRAFT_1314517 [Collybia nuda]|uniref:Tetratricopeptide repeat protein 1 n=1 Tax=Collybia nuda TaxID=64659 RepID=A0A9P5XV07_9AGAR|nr:hypothetical protein BDZ94DRAFT_1314517 [Collybia nuda]